MFLYGYAMKVGANGPLCAFLAGVMQLGVILGLSATTSYALDAYREESNEVFIMAMLFKVRPPRCPFAALILSASELSLLWL